MNPGLLHEHLAEQGFDVISVDEKGNVVLADPSLAADAKFLKAVSDYKEPTRDELKTKLLAKREALLDQLIFERFLPPERTPDG